MGIHRSSYRTSGTRGWASTGASYRTSGTRGGASLSFAGGEWDRVLGPSVTERHGITGILLDPPYSSAEHSVTYSAQHRCVSDDVRDWAIANGDNPNLRIALCGYEAEHAMPESWERVEWKARGGYGSQGDGRGRDNAARERIWFSPHCTKVGLFGGFAVAGDDVIPSGEVQESLLCE
jgi:hypothetical protein